MKIGTITANLIVDDVNAALDFYCNVLGFRVMQTLPGERRFSWALVEKDDCTLMFQARAAFSEEMAIPMEFGKNYAISLYFEIDDVETLFNDVKSKAHVFRQPNITFYGTEEFALLDPFSNILVFASEITADDESIVL